MSLLHSKLSAQAAKQQRAVQRRARSSVYAAAQSPRTSNNWSPINNNINDILAMSGPAVRARVRQLVRDFPYFARAVNVLVDYTVGDGIRFQSRILNAKGTFDNKKIQQVEDAFARWSDEADAGGRLHLSEMMRLAKRHEVECGEFLIVKKRLADRKRFLPLALQVYESDWLTDMGATPKNGKNRIHQGVEFDTDTGRAIAYHFTDPDGWGKTISIDAADVLHGFRTLRAGQLRGISDLTPGVMVAHDMSDLLDAELDGAKMAAKWLAVVKAMDPMAAQAARAAGTGDDAKIEELENAIIEYLRPGEDIDIKSNPRPGSNFAPYIKLNLCMIAVVTGCPYELLSGDYGDVSWSTSKTIRADFAVALKPAISRHIRQFCEPIKQEFFDAAVLAGKLNFPRYFLDPLPMQRGVWQAPGMEPTDPARETKSMIDQIMNGLRSPQEIAQARGRDSGEILDEIAEFQKMAEEKGVTLQTTSTALANNPSALEQQSATTKATEKASASREKARQAETRAQEIQTGQQKEHGELLRSLVDSVGRMASQPPAAAAPISITNPPLEMRVNVEPPVLPKPGKKTVNFVRDDRGEIVSAQIEEE